MNPRAPGLLEPQQHPTPANFNRKSCGHTLRRFVQTRVSKTRLWLCCRQHWWVHDFNRKCRSNNSGRASFRWQHKFLADLQWKVDGQKCQCVGAAVESCFEGITHRMAGVIWAWIIELKMLGEEIVRGCFHSCHGWGPTAQNSGFESIWIVAQRTERTGLVVFVREFIGTEFQQAPFE